MSADHGRVSARVVRLVTEYLSDPVTRGAPVRPSARQLAIEVARAVGLGLRTVQRALKVPDVAEIAGALVDGTGTPTGATGTPTGAPLVDEAPKPADGAITPHVSTRGSLLSGPVDVPPRPPGRRPKEFRVSRFAGQCVLCLEDLPAGRGFYLTPYVTGTSVYCASHAPLGLAMAQMFYDVSLGRPVAEELQLFIRGARP